MREIIINSNLSGSRLDKTALKYIGNAPMSFVYKMLRKKNITLNDKKAAGNELLKTGDRIKIYISEDTFELFKRKTSDGPGSDELKKYIIYEDDEIIAMDKPAGMLSQKAAASDISINELLVAYLKKDMLFLPGISNRLDRNTSGIILAGKNPMASKLLNIAIRERYLTKKYLCLVKGELTLKGSFEAFLVKDNDTNQVSVSESGAENDRIITGIKPLAYNGRSTLTEIDLITGKPHQIRAHLAFLGHPLAGDTKYGDTEYNDYFRRKYNLKWQLLHAYRIEFDEMTDNLNYLNRKHIEAPLPDQFDKILKGENLWQHGIPED